MSEQGDILHVSGGFVGKAQTHPSTLYMDGTSPVTVKIQATTDELRELHNQQVRIVPVDVRPISGDYVHRYHHDPVFHARVHVGAQALLKRWQDRSVLNQSPTDAEWAEAKLLAFTVLKAAGQLDVSAVSGCTCPAGGVSVYCPVHRGLPDVNDA